MKSKRRGPALIGFVAIVLAIPTCAYRSERGGARLPLEAAPETTWGTTDVDLRFYELREVSESKLRQEIREVRATRGMRGYGDTQWQIRTSYDFSTSGDACEPTRVDVSLDLRVTLPQLRKPDALSPELRTKWRKFLHAVREHQANHKRIAIDCAEQVSAELAAVGSVGCELLADHMQKATEDVTSTCHARNADFDLRTRHGASEGATF